MPSAQIKLTSSQLLNLLLQTVYAPLYCACHSTVSEATTQNWEPGNYLSGSAFTPQLFGPLLNWWTWNDFQPGFAQQCNCIRMRHPSRLTIFEQFPLEETSDHGAEDLQRTSDDYRTRSQGTYHGRHPLLNLHTTIFRVPDVYFLLGVVMFHFSLQWHSCSSKRGEQSPVRSRANGGRQVIPLGRVRAGTPHLRRVREAESPILSHRAFTKRTPLSDYSYSFLS